MGGVLSPFQRAGPQRVLGKEVLTGLCVLFIMAHDPVCGAPQCPPGGQWVDKHVGPNGRLTCCSELCEPKGFFPLVCQKKCPDYEDLKARAATSTTTTADPSDAEAEVGSQISSAQQQHGPSSNAFLYVLIPVAICVILVGGTAFFWFRKVTRRVKGMFQSNRTAGATGLGERHEQGGEAAAAAGVGVGLDGDGAADNPTPPPTLGQNEDGVEGARGGEDASDPLLANEGRQGDPHRQPEPGGRSGNTSLSTSRDRFPDQTAKEDNRLPIPVEDRTCEKSVHGFNC